MVSVSSTKVPPEVAELLGPARRRLSGYGECAVLAGSGNVAKIGPNHVVAREARILGELANSVPLELSALVASGFGWLVMEEVADVAAAWDERQFIELLADLARLHDPFASSPALDGGWLRDPAGADLAATLAGGGERLGVELPDPLARVLDDPSPVAGILARSRPLTLVHGDPNPANVRRPETIEGRVWIDWEWASAASAAVDLACWLGEWPWRFGRRFDREVCIGLYLGARRRPVERAELEHALDAALVLFLFANDLPNLAREEGSAALQALIDERSEALQRLGLA